MFMQAPTDNAAQEAERQELKVEIRQSAVQTKVKMNGLKNGNRLENETNRAMAIEQQLNAPVTAPAVEPKDCHIGKWNGSLINGSNLEYLQNLQQEMLPGTRYDKLPENQRIYLANIKRPLQDEIVKGLLAQYRPSEDTIYIQPLAVSKDAHRSEIEYANQNPIAENSIVLHEAVHKRHANHNGLRDITLTPVNTLRADRLTETTAYAVQYLSVANMYTQLKNQGVKTFEYTSNKDGKEKTVTMPLEDALDMYPGLREAMDGKDFSPDDPKMIRKIVDASTKEWNNLYEINYYQQHMQSMAPVYMYQQDATFSLRLRNTINQKNQDKDFAKLSQEMLQDVYVGNNTTVDLTSCEDLLNSMSSERANELLTYYKTQHALATLQDNPTSENKETQAVEKWLEKKGLTEDKQSVYINKAIENIPVHTMWGKSSTDPEFIDLLSKALISTLPEPSDEEVFAINEYLERKGLHTDEEKDKYMEKAFTDIVNRSPEADPELKKLLLGNSGSIKYTDGLVETPIPNTECSIVADKDGKTYNIGTLSHFSSRLEERRQSENTAAKEQTNTASFAPAQLHQLKERSGR